MQSEKCSKTQNARGSRLHLQQSLYHKSFAECFTEKKNRQHFHHHTAYDYRSDSKSRWYATARCWYTTGKPFLPRMFTNPGLLLTNVAVCDKPFCHCQVARHFGRRYSTYAYAVGQCKRYVYHSTFCIPTALALSSVVIRRMTSSLNLHKEYFAY